jgi:spore coat polysaccharide biosynthesis predicted glycosyltransferase SpsG
MSTLSYIRFLWKSQNDHGIHSPFLFRFVSKCFYAKGPRLSKRAYREKDMQIGYPYAELLYRIVNYLKPAKSFAIGENADSVMEMLRYASEENKIKLWFFSSLAPIPGGIDLAVIADKKKEAVMASFERVLSDINNDTVCIIGNIHGTPEIEAAWQWILDHPKVTVTVDTYHTGLVFFRREQVKQHFTVRPSKSFFRDAILGLKNGYGLLG